MIAPAQGTPEASAAVFPIWERKAGLGHLLSSEGHSGAQVDRPQTSAPGAFASWFCTFAQKTSNTSQSIKVSEKSYKQGSC